MTFAQRRNRLTAHFSERISVVKRRLTICTNYGVNDAINKWIRYTQMQVRAMHCALRQLITMRNCALRTQLNSAPHDPRVPHVYQNSAISCVTSPTSTAALHTHYCLTFPSLSVPIHVLHSSSSLCTPTPSLSAVPFR